MTSAQLRVGKLKVVASYGELQSGMGASGARGRKIIVIGTRRRTAAAAAAYIYTGKYTG